MKSNFETNHSSLESVQFLSEKNGNENTILDFENLTSENTRIPAVLRAIEYAKAAGMDDSPVGSNIHYYNLLDREQETTELEEQELDDCLIQDEAEELETPKAEVKGKGSHLNSYHYKPLVSIDRKEKKRARETKLCLTNSGEIRFFSRELENAFLAMKDLIIKRIVTGRLVLATVYFSHKAKAKNLSAHAYGKKLRERGWGLPTIIVLEHGKASKKLSHAHIITISEESASNRFPALRELLKKDANHYDSAIKIQDSYITKFRYTDLTALEEEQSGNVIPPIEEHNSEYWMKTWRPEGSNYIHRRLPIDVGIADYLSKQLTDENDNQRLNFINFGTMISDKKRELVKLSREFRKKYKTPPASKASKS
ncbi:hypothetical protein [Shewanella mangrovisoli]|uniref:Large polyvalent protein-associated domain-containing protein n=1 Tax=Shewanella mangrovisoli TaxID=2864211 RepID=A0ABV4VND5_9GAMM